MNYTATAKKVAKKIKKDGKPAIIVRPGDATGWTKKFDAKNAKWYWEDGSGTIVYIDPATDVEVPCSVLETKYEIKHIDGSLIQQGDRLFLCSEHPALGETLRTDEVDLTVIQAVPLRPGEVTIYTEVQAR